MQLRNSNMKMKYSNMREAKTWIKMNNLHSCCSLGNMFELRKYGGSPLKMKFKVTLTLLVPGATVQNMTRAIIDISLQAAENEDQNHSCPRQEERYGRVLSLAWMMPRWKPVRGLDY